MIFAVLYRWVYLFIYISIGLEYFGLFFFKYLSCFMVYMNTYLFIGAEYFRE